MAPRLSCGRGAPESAGAGLVTDVASIRFLPPICPTRLQRGGGRGGEYRDNPSLTITFRPTGRQPVRRAVLSVCADQTAVGGAWVRRDAPTDALMTSAIPTSVRTLSPRPNPSRPAR